MRRGGIIVICTPCARSRSSSTASFPLSESRPYTSFDYGSHLLRDHPSARSRLGNANPGFCEGARSGLISFFQAPPLDLLHIALTA